MKRSKNHGSQAGFSDYRNVHYPSLLEGMASVIDLYGVSSQEYFDRVLSTDDREALYSDWEKVGRDLWEVLVRSKTEFLERLSVEMQGLEGPLDDETIQKALEESISHLLVQQNIESTNHEQV
jgi:hypothetical protein